MSDPTDSDSAPGSSPAEPRPTGAASDASRAADAPTERVHEPAAPAQPGYQAPSGPAYAPPAAASPQPPYAAAGQYPGAPQAPYPAAGQPGYAGSPAYPAAGAFAPVAAPGDRPKTLAIIALVAAVVGLAMSFIPVVTWFSGVFLLAAFVMALIALISKKQGGKGFSIAALIISVVGWIVSIVVTVASFAVIGQAAEDAINEGRQSEVTSGTEGEEAPAEQEAADAQEIAVVESAFGRSSMGDTWWYVVILDNPNPDHVFDFASIDVEALSADGTILDTSTDFVTLLSGQTAITGSFFSVAQGEIASLDVRGPDASEAFPSPADETGAFTIEGLTATSDSFSTSVTGTVAGDFEEEQELVSVVVVARSADGAIVGGQLTFIDRLPVDGGKVQFEAVFFDELPADAVFEAYASL